MPSPSANCAAPCPLVVRLRCARSLAAVSQAATQHKQVAQANLDLITGPPTTGVAAIRALKHNLKQRTRLWEEAPASSMSLPHMNRRKG